MSRMSFKDALELVDDDLPDGAYWAMAHDIAGLEYGDGFPELFEDDGFDESRLPNPVKTKKIRCTAKGCKRKFGNEYDRDQHVKAKHAARQSEEPTS